MSSKIYIVGMGPGTGEMMTPQADHALCGSDVIVGYPVYLKLLGGKYRKKEFLSTPMKQEVRRCEMCFEEAEKGKTVAMVCSGDAGVYGMASLLYEMSEAHPGCELEVIPGITAANSGAAALGAPLNHDYCVISLSDLMTPWELIEKRLAAAAVGDFCMAIYNPSSHHRADYLLHTRRIAGASGEYVYNGIYWKFQNKNHRWETYHTKRVCAAGSGGLKYAVF